MCLAWQDGKSAVGKQLVLVLALIQWHILIDFALPNIKSDLYVLQFETPCGINQDVVLCGAIPTLPVALLNALNQQISAP